MKMVVGILLAAGSARRFGAPKLLHTLPDGAAIGVTAATTLLQVLPDTIAVVQPGDHALIDAFTHIGMQVVENSRADTGMGTSLAAGVNASSSADGWLIALADMPWIQPATITTLVDRLKDGASMVAPEYRGQRGHPVGFSARWQQPLQELSGDKGARDLIAKYPDELELLTSGDSGVLRDIDHPQDLNR
jgi:molybdenum cofactor cytidylyltransferase